MENVLRHPFFLISATLILGVGCSNSEPTIKILQKTLSPSKNGATEWTERVNGLGSPVQIPSSMIGTCDPRATGLEYSIDDGATWLNAATLSGSDADCADGTFQFSLPASVFSFNANSAASRILKIRQILGGAATTAALVTVKYEIARLRPAGLRMVLGSLSLKNSQVDVKLRAYARGDAR